MDFVITGRGDFILRISCQKDVSAYSHVRKYLVRQYKQVWCMLRQKGVILMLFCIDMQTVTFESTMNNNSHFPDTNSWHDTLDTDQRHRCVRS
jgi:hypothetical protein